MKVNNRKRVLYLRQSLSANDIAKLNGVMCYADEAGWELQTIELSALVETEHSGVRPNVGKLIGFWKPDGCIVNGGLRPILLQRGDFRDVPVVFLDRDPSTAQKGTTCIFSDSKSIAETAAVELFAPGCRDYAYVSWFGDPEWSRGRECEFKRCVREAGGVFHAFLGQAVDTRGRLLELKRWVRTLPVPCGIFCANDFVAKLTVCACLAAGISVPEELFVLGVDNDEQICEHVQPSISSVRQDMEGGGRTAAAALAALMAGRKPELVSFGAFGVVRRESTLRIACGNARVRRAIEFIRRHATRGIGVSDVIAEMGCSRSLANLRFREITGQSILSTIHEIRMKRACEYLRNSRQDLSALPDLCGYRSNIDFRRVFRKHFGVSPGVWRKKVGVSVS